MTQTSTTPSKAIRYPGFGVLFLAWTVLGALSYVRQLLLTDTPQTHILTDLSGWMTCYYPWVLITPLIFRLEGRFPLDRLKWPKHLAWLAVAGIPVVYLACEMAKLLNAGVEAALRQPQTLAVSWWSVQRCEFLMQLALSSVAVGGACVIRKLGELQQSERRAVQLALEKSEIEASLRKAELETLRMRLNPHFLFNCLQNISTLARQDPDTASQMLVRLGDLLRAALHKGAQAETTLAAEVALTKAYVAVEQMRFGDRLSVLFEVDPEAESALVPSFLLQPLVENAITRGLRGERPAGVIWIRGMRQLNEIVLTVSDNGSGPPKENINDLDLGIGLGSTSERLERMYPDQHKLSILKLPEGGTGVRIVLPLRVDETRQEIFRHEPTSFAHR